MNFFQVFGKPRQKKQTEDVEQSKNKKEEEEEAVNSNAEFSTVVDFVNELPKITPEDADSGVSSTGHKQQPSLWQLRQDNEKREQDPGDEDKTAANGVGAKDDAQVTPSSTCTTTLQSNCPSFPGHVFVLLADITKLACDAWVGASGGVIDPIHVHDFPFLPSQAKKMKRSLDGKKTRITSYHDWPDNLPRAYVARIDGEGRGDAQFYINTLENYIRVALEDLQDKPPLLRRKTHLIAMPLLGSGHGGGRSRTGELVRGLMPVLMESAHKHGVDFAIVTIEPSIWAAAQSERVKYVQGINNVASANLCPNLVQKAIELSEFALAGQLAVFIGAGISVGAGLPLWEKLLEELAVDAGITEDQKDHFDKMTLYDRARIIQRRLEKKEKSIGELVSSKLRCTRYSVAHSLLASLPVNEIITTNYDTLFEEAARLVEDERPISILPHLPVSHGTRWLLKMHGCVTHPDDIVLTRRDYIRYAERGAALGGIVQSTLLTKHLMFVGFSLSDDNFHRVFDAVLKASPVEMRHDQRNTALMLVRSQLQAELWDGEVGLTYIQEEGVDDYDIADLARKHDIMLDLLSASCAIRGRADFLLNDRFEMMLTAPELELKHAVNQLVNGLSDEAKNTPAWAVIQSALMKLGTNDRHSSYFKHILKAYAGL